MQIDGSSRPNSTRRAVLAGVGVAAAAFFAGCSKYGSSGGSGDGGGGGGGPAASPGAKLAQTSDIPVGGGKIFADAQVVVTQPQSGTFKGFSAICTHQQCTVSEVTGGTIRCPCHGSQYKVADGSVVVGPATQPLPPVNVKVNGTAITLG